MSLREKESLSALMDGETDDLELRRLLKHLPLSEESAELRAVWDRFNLARSVLHGEDVKTVSPDLTMRILAAVDAEPALQPEEVDTKESDSPVTITPVPGTWMQPLVKFAVFASFAMVFLFVMAPLSNFQQNNQPFVQNDQSSDSVLISDNFSPVDDAEAKQHLDDYINNVSLEVPNGTRHDPLFQSQLIRPVNRVQFELSFDQ